MKAFVIESPNRMVVESRPEPAVRDGEVLIQVTHIGVCGSDSQLFGGTYKGPFSYPILFGHEWAGVVRETGRGVRGFAPGDAVTGDCSRYCGTCPNCQVDRNVCRSIEKFGITVDGASAERIVREARYLYKAPPDLDRELLCLAEPLAVSAHLLDRIAAAAGDLPRREVLILGGGAIGVGALMLLRRHHRCSRVDLLERSPYRLARAREMGAGEPPAGVLRAEADTRDYHALYAGGLYDLVLDTTGNPDAFRTALRVARPRGIIGSLGMMPEVSIEQKLIVLKALTVVGGIGGTGAFPQVIDFIHGNRDLVRRMISHALPVERAGEAFELGRNAEQSLKVVLRLDG